MSTFALDKNYKQFNFDEISVAELEVISGGSGGGGFPWPLPGPTFPGPIVPGPTFPGPGYPGGPSYSGGGSWG